MRSVFAFATLGLALGAHAASEAPSFSRDIAPLLRSQCAGCHLTGDEPGGMKLYPAAAYQTLVNTPSKESPLKRVAPGQPEQSYLLHKLRGTHLDAGGSGVQMPFGQAPLPEDKLQLIRLWIEQGAAEN